MQSIIKNMILSLGGFCLVLGSYVTFAAEQAKTDGTKTQKKVLAIRKGQEDFSKVFESAKNELKNYQVVELVIDQNSTYDQIKAKIESEAPDALLLLDNQAVTHAKKFFAEDTPLAQKMKAVATMGLNLKAVLKGDKKICAIAYETPLVTLVNGFKDLSKSDIKKVLTFYRKSKFEDTIKDATRHLSRIGIELVAVNVEDDGTSPDNIAEFIKENLPKKVNSGEFQAFWLMLDNGILTPDLLGNVWLPVAKDNKIPFLVGTEKFASKSFDLAVFATTPDLDALGSQTAQMLISVVDDGIDPSSLGVKYMINVKKVFNLEKGKKLSINVSTENLKDVRVIE